MKRFGLMILVMFFFLPLASRMEARRTGPVAQRDDDRDRDRHDLVINRAIYGSGNKQHDITAPLNAEIHDGRLRLQVINGTMGGDPDKNHPKTLQVWFTYNGRQDQVTLQENDYLELPGPWAFDDHVPSRNDLVITRAIYGAGDKQHDITAPLNAEIHNGRLRLQVINGTMGGDPAKNQPKTLQVWFTYDGRQEQVTLHENDYLELPGPWAFDDRDRDHR